MNFNRYKIGILKIYLILVIISSIIQLRNNTNINYSHQYNENLYSNENVIENAGTTLKIMSSITIVQDIVQNIVGNLTSVDVIVSGTQDIHTFPGPTENQKIKLSEANIFFVMGLEDLEPWLNDTLNSLGSNAPLTIRLVNNSMLKYDDIIQSYNPHVWLDPNIIKLMANNITAELQLLDNSSENKVIYSQNNQTYQEKLDQLINRIESNKTLLSGKKVVENHPAFKYLLDLLGMVRVDALEKIEGEEPTPSDIQRLINVVKEQDVDLLINVQWADQNDFYEIARETKIKIAKLVPLIAGVDQNNNPITNYIQMIDYNLWALNNPIEPPKTISGYLFSFLLLAPLILIFEYYLYKKEKMKFF